MGTKTDKPQEDPAEGSRETVDRQLKQGENRRETGARKLEERREPKSATDKGAT